MALLVPAAVALALLQAALTLRAIKLRRAHKGALTLASYAAGALLLRASLVV